MIAHPARGTKAAGLEMPSQSLPILRQITISALASKMPNRRRCVDFQIASWLLVGVGAGHETNCPSFPRPGRHLVGSLIGDVVRLRDNAGATSALCGRAAAFTRL